MSSLANKARSAVAWNAGFTLFRDLVQFGTMLILVRLLSPESYGEFGLTNGIIGFISIFSFTNFVGYTLQVQADSEARYQEHFTAGGVFQGTLFLLANAVALGLRWIPAYSSVGPLVHAMSLTFLLEWPCELRRKMLERSLDWRRLRVLHGVGLLLSAGLSLVLAWAGAGAFALLVPGMLVTIPFIFDLFVAQAWRPDWSWSWAAYRPALRFGLARVGSGLVGGGRQLLESGVVTALVGFAALGLLSRSVGFATMFCQRIASQLLYAIYPVLTRIEGGGGDPVRAGTLVLRLVMWTVTPIAVTLAVLAEPVIRIVYGERWTAVIPLLPWAMAWGAVSAGTHSAYMLLLARHQARMCLLSDVGVLGGTALALFLVLSHGTLQYLVAITVIQSIALAFLLTALTRVGGASAPGVTFALLPPSISAGIAWASLATLRWWFGWEAPTTFLGAMTWGASFSSLYVALLRLAFRQQLVELIAHFPAHRTWSRCLFLGSELDRA